MKKIISLLFVVSLVAGVATGNLAIIGLSVAGLAFANADKKSFKSAVTAITLVPAIQRAPDGSEIPPFTRAQKFLFDFLRQKSNVVTLDAFIKETLFFDPINYYVRSVIPKLQQGRYQILGANTSQVVGASNFYAQAILPQYYNFCFDRMQVNYGTANVDGAAAQAIGGWSNVRSSAPVALGNGEVIIQLNKNIIVQTGISDFMSEAAVTGGGSLDFAGGALQTPRIFQENLQIEGDLNLAQNQAFGNDANTTYGAEIIFKGAQLRLR